MILRKLTYEKSHTRFLFKALLKALWQSSSISSPVIKQSIVTSIETAYFEDSHSFGAWILTQPTSDGVVRKIRKLKIEEMEITFFDEVLSSGIRRFLVLNTSGKSEDKKTWVQFAHTAIQEGVVYVDVFTTIPALDLILSSLGARRHEESSILVKGLKTHPEAYNIQGWDRENWTFQATMSKTE